MGVQLKFRHRIGLIVVLAALALAAVTIVALVLGQRSEQQLSGIENQYVPLLELDRDLKRTFEQIPKAFEDAATAADESRLSDADQLRAEFVRRLKTGARAIKDNGSDANMLEVAFLGYYDVGRAVSAALASDTSPAELGPKIEAMRDRQQAFAAQLDLATRPDRSRLAAAFQTARASQDTSIKINVAVACLALALMVFLSWQLARRTVKSLHAVSEGVERLARGDVGTEIDVPAGDEIGDLAREANRTAVRLRDYRELVEREAWIQTGLAELADRIAGELDPVTLGHNAIHHVATYVGAGSAAIYAVDGEGVFRLVERYGVESDAPAIASFRLGETVLGEAAVRGEVRTQPLPADNGLSKPSSGAALHHHVLVPLIHEARTLGVLELAMADAPSERTITLMNRVRGALGIAFEVAESRQEAKMLLIETQRQALAAETANKELEAFSYSVSHDLRAPLRGIDGFSQALAEDEAPNLTDRGRDYLRRIRAAAQRMAELIDDLLQLSRVSRSDFKKERVDLSALVATVLAELQRADPDRKVHLTIQSNVTAIADSRLIRITLENLLGNAWKFTSKVADPTIEFGSVEQDDQQIYFIRDNGAGFDMKYVERLFGAFQRLHTDKEFPGTGIGLATVQRVVLRHGGKIWVEAEVGKGAKFQFTLPARSNVATTSRTATRELGS